MVTAIRAGIILNGGTIKDLTTPAACFAPPVLGRPWAPGIFQRPSPGAGVPSRLRLSRDRHMAAMRHRVAEGFGCPFQSRLLGRGLRVALRAAYRRDCSGGKQIVMDVESCLAPRPINPSKALEYPTCGVAQAYKPKLTCSAVTPWALISQYNEAGAEDEQGPLLGADIHPAAGEVGDVTLPTSYVDQVLSSRSPAPRGSR
jgi:hypothetical protein